MTNVIPIKGAQTVRKADQSRVETLLLTPEIVCPWRIPPFQRPLRVNAKIRAIAEEMKSNGGFVTGVLTLGRIGDGPYYIVDGQHRIEAARLSELAEFIADVRLITFATMAEMAEEFVRLNTALVRFGPDDILRGLESSSKGLQHIRKYCDFVGYDHIRRTTASPVLGMSTSLRCWYGSMGDTPTGTPKSAAALAEELKLEDAEQLVAFLNLCRAAWGRDPENYRLWGQLNLTICMWLYRKLVLERERGVKRYILLNGESFKKCMMSLSASKDYIDWLVHRSLTDRERSPCYTRVRSIFVKRLKDGGIQNPKLPQPPWSTT